MTCPVCGDTLVAPAASAVDRRCALCRAMGDWHPPEPHRPPSLIRDRRASRDRVAELRGLAAAARAVVTHPGHNLGLAGPLPASITGGAP